MSKTKEKINSPEEFLKLDPEERFNDCDLTWDSVVDYMQEFSDQQLELFKEKLKNEIENKRSEIIDVSGHSAGYNSGLKTVIELIDTIKP
jgi:hypothetical protein